MQDPECIHTCFEVSVKLQGAQEGAGRGTEEEGMGEMEEQKPQQCHCQPQACQDHTENLQSQGRGSFFVSPANEADTSLSSLNQSDHQAQPKLIHS